MRTKRLWTGWLAIVVALAMSAPALASLDLLDPAFASAKCGSGLNAFGEASAHGYNPWAEADVTPYQTNGGGHGTTYDATAWATGVGFGSASAGADDAVPAYCQSGISSDLVVDLLRD